MEFWLFWVYIRIFPNINGFLGVYTSMKTTIYACYHLKFSSFHQKQCAFLPSDENKIEKKKKNNSFFSTKFWLFWVHIRTFPNMNGFLGIYTSMKTTIYACYHLLSREK